MRASDLKLNCYAEKERDGSWLAVCVNLNLVAQGVTFDEAKTKLHAIIFDYVNEALTIDKEYINDLIPRRAPFQFIMKYYLIKLFGEKGAASDKKLFNDVLPVVPHYA